MVHFLIDLDDTIKTLLLCDDTIIELREFDYTMDLLDKLAVQLTKYEVTKMSVITHGVVSSCLYDNGCVAFPISVKGELMLCSVSTDDVNAIKSLADKCNIKDVTFYDKLGYYLALGKKGVCYVDKHNGMQTVLALDSGAVLGVSMCTENSISEKLQSFCADNALQSVCCDSTDEDNLMFFANSAMVLDDKVTVHDLSVFAYACLNLFPDASYDFSVLQNVTANILKSGPSEPATEEIIQIDDLSDNIIAEVETKKRKPMFGKPAKAAKPAKPTKAEKTTKPIKPVKEESSVPAPADKKATTLMVLGLLCICLTIGIVVEDMYLKRKQVKAAEEVTNVQTVMDSTKSTISAYEYCLNTEGSQALDLFNNVYGSVTANEGTVETIDSNDSSSTVVVSFGSEEEATVFTDSVNLAGATIDTVDASENDVAKYTVTIRLAE